MTNVDVVSIEQEYDVVQQHPRFAGSWESRRRSEEGPGWENVEDAVAWAQERAPRVFLRLVAEDDPTKKLSYSAGELDFVEGLPRWQPDTPAGRTDGDASDAPYAGKAYIEEQEPLYEILDTYSARWERHRAGRVELVEAATGMRVEEALAWARARAQAIVIRFGDPSDFEWVSAGEVQPPGRRLERWPIEY